MPTHMPVVADAHLPRSSSLPAHARTFRESVLQIDRVSPPELDCIESLIRKLNAGAKVRMITGVLPADAMRLVCASKLPLCGDWL